MASVSRRDVYLKAREYIRTPFHQQGRLKGIGIDCIGIAVCVGSELGLRYKDGRPIGIYDHRDYGLFPVFDELQTKVRELLVEYSRAPLPGDVLTMRAPFLVHHMAIVSDLGAGRLGIIHAYGSLGKVSEHILDDRWRRRIAGVFGYTGLSD